MVIYGSNGDWPLGIMVIVSGINGVSWSLGWLKVTRNNGDWSLGLMVFDGCWGGERSLGIMVFSGHWGN